MAQRKSFTQNGTFNIVMAAFSAVQVLYNTVLVIIGWHGNLFLTGVHAFGVVGWLVGAIIWFQIYRMNSLRARGWVVTKQLERREPLYVGQGETVEQSAWADFI